MPDVKRLKTAIEWSIRQLEEPRRKRLESLRYYVGSHYARHGADRCVPTNMIELAVTIYVQNLAARAPKVMVSTGADHLKPFARVMELALNQIPEEIDLARTLRRIVVESLFGLGVCKVGLANSGANVLGHDPGEPFVDLVSPDDYFLDMSAKTRGALQFEGNDYWLDLDAARSIYGNRLQPDEHTVQGADGSERADGVSVDEGADLYMDKVWLRDVWLPKTEELLTMSVKTGEVLRTVPWDGPEHGPYYTLSFADVPGNLLPLPPVALWRDLHELANNLFRKLAKQAETKKSVVAFSGGDEESITNLRKAGDGDGIRYTGQKPEQIVVGGVDQDAMAVFLQSRDLFSYFAGNLDALGGLAPMTDTVGQDKLLTQGANARMQRMKSDATGFAARIFKALAWYEWTDPVRKRVILHPVKGLDTALKKVWSEETREGDFLDYNLVLDPYSMEEDTPSLRLQKLGQVVERFVLPLLPLLQQQGVQLDGRKLFETIARLSNLDELRDVLTFSEPIPGLPQQGGAEAPSFKPSHTTRTYERVNRPGATRHGKDDVLTRMLMGGGVQQSEAAALGRSAS